MSVVKLNKDNFESEVIDAKRVVLIDFYADWCGPCRMVGPIVEQLAAEHPDVKVGKVNVDSEHELAEKFGIVSIPSLIVMKDGKVINKSVGFKPKAQIESMLV